MAVLAIAYRDFPGKHQSPQIARKTCTENKKLNEIRNHADNIDLN